MMPPSDRLGYGSQIKAFGFVPRSQRKTGPISLLGITIQDNDFLTKDRRHFGPFLNIPRKRRAESYKPSEISK